MVNKRYIASIAKRMHKSATKHRDIIKAGGDAQHMAKQAIFALHRNDQKTAIQKLTIAKKGLLSLQKKYTQQELLSEGSYRASLEEYVEAELLVEYTRGNAIGPIEALVVTDDIYLAGLGDVPGELYRFAVRDVTGGDTDVVMRHAQTAAAIVEVLVSMDLTKYLRTKTDQAKQALHRLEKVQYELALRS